MSGRISSLLLVLLTVTSGCVDAVSFIGLGQVFTAAMTGNTVLFGLAVAHTGGLSAIRYAAALFGFVVGAGIGSVVVRRNRTSSGWNAPVLVTLGVELGALILSGILVSTSPVELTDARIVVLVIALSVAMGLQSVAARRVGVSGVTTTVITSTLTGLVEAVVWKASSSVSRNQHSERTGASPLSAIFVWISVIVSYGAGAAICGALMSRWHLQAVWLPCAIVFIVIFSAYWMFQRATRATKIPAAASGDSQVN